MTKKDYFNISQAIIFEDNIQRIAELISLKALKLLCQFSQKAFIFLYKGLIRDVYHSNYPNHIYSDGYDIVQTAICFLWEYLGKRMDTVISTDKKGNPVDIKRACFKVVNHQVHKYSYTFHKFRSLDLLPTEKEYVAPEVLQEQQDYSIVEETLEKMHLNQGQQDVLDCFMNGMSYRKTANYLDIAVSTVFRRRLKMQILYNSL
jgi:hypothetical protein